MNKLTWREGSESTPDKPTWICVGKLGIYGRVTSKNKGFADHSWWFDCCAVGGYQCKSASGYTQSLELAKQIVELIVQEDAIENIQDRLNQVERILDHLDPFPDYGDLMTLEEFVEACVEGSFGNDDGTGCYATKSGMSRIYAHPTDMCAGKIDRSWTHVMWFNK